GGGRALPQASAAPSPASTPEPSARQAPHRLRGGGERARRRRWRPLRGRPGRLRSVDPRDAAGSRHYGSAPGALLVTATVTSLGPAVSITSRSSSSPGSRPAITELRSAAEST